MVLDKHNTRDPPSTTTLIFSSRFFLHVKQNLPAAFIFENVPPVRPFAERRAARLKSAGYRFASTLVKYSDFGAPTSRHRYFMIGARKRAIRLSSFHNWKSSGPLLKPSKTRSATSRM